MSANTIFKAFVPVFLAVVLGTLTAMYVADKVEAKKARQ
jgi:hypothetical protein